MSCVDVPLRDGSGTVMVPTGKNLPADVDQVLKLLSKERPKLGVWVSIGAEYYLEGKADEALRLFKAAEGEAKDESLRAADEQGAVAINVALGSYYSRAAAKAKKNGDEIEAARLQDLAQRNLDASLEYGHIESDLPWLGDGLFQLAKGQIDAAGSRFDAALDLSDNKSHFGLLGKACCEFSSGNYEMALRSYVEALKRPEKCSPSVRVGLAHCFYRLGDHAMAEKAFARARELEPSNVQAAIGLALLRLNSSNDTADPENVQAAMHLLCDAYAEDDSNPMALNHLATHFFWKGELDRVKEFCMDSYKATTHAGMRSESLLLLARAHHRSKDYVKASRYYNDALIAFNEHSKKANSGTANNKDSAGKPPVLLLVGLAQMHLVEGDVEAAVRKFEEALKRAPDCKELVLTLGSLHKSYKRKKKLSTARNGGRPVVSRAYAVQYLKKAAELDSGNVDAQLEMAELTQTVGTEQHYKQALRHYKKAELAKIRLNEVASSQIHNNVSVLHFQLGDMKDAMQAMKRALREAVREDGGGDIDESLLQDEIGEDNAQPKSDSSSSMSSSQPPEESRSSAEKIANAILTVYKSNLFNRGMITLAYNLARLFEQSGAVDQACTVYKKLISKYPLYIDPHLRLANIHADAGDMDAALKRVQDALVVQPGDANCLSLRGNLNLKIGNADAAKASFEQIVAAKQSSKVAKKDSYAFVSLGNIDFAQAGSSLSLGDSHGVLSSVNKGRLQNALQMYKRVVDQEAKNAYAANGIGMVLAELGHLEKAAKIFFAINEATPNMLQSRINLAHLHMANGRYKAACQLYEFCADRCKPHKKVEYLNYLARAQTSAGMSTTEKFDDALATMEKIKALSPDDVNLRFNFAIVKYNYANCILEKARKEWAQQKDLEKRSFLYCTLQKITDAKDLMISAHKLFDEANDAVELAGVHAKTKGFLYTSKVTRERSRHIATLLEDAIPIYITHAEREDKKELEARKEAKKSLADHERLEEIARKEDMERAEREKQERDRQARELMEKAMEANIKQAREMKAIKAASKEKKRKRNTKRDVSIKINDDSDVSMDSISEDSGSDSDSDSGSEVDSMKRNENSPKKDAQSALSPVRKKARQSRLSVFSDDDDSDDSDEGDDDNMFATNSSQAQSNLAAFSDGGNAEPSATDGVGNSNDPKVAPSAPPPLASASVAAMMDDDEEED